MHDLLENYTIRVLSPNNETRGAGFIVNNTGLAVSCAHVIRAASPTEWGKVDIEIYHNQKRYRADVIDTFWSELDDLAILKINTDSEFFSAAPLGFGKQSSQHRFISLGFPTLGDRTAHFAQGKIGGVVSLSSTRQPLLELQGLEFEKGMSGGAILDTDVGKVVGIMAEYLDTKKSRIAYAITIETLLKICPDLAPETFDNPLSVVEDILMSILRIQSNFYLSLETVNLVRNLAQRFDLANECFSKSWQAHADNNNKMTADSVVDRTSRALNDLEAILVKLKLTHPSGIISYKANDELERCFRVTTDALNSMIKLLE